MAKMIEVKSIVIGSVLCDIRKIIRRAACNIYDNP